MRFTKHIFQQVALGQVRLYQPTVSRKTMSKEIGIKVLHNSPEQSMVHVELGLLFLQLAQFVILLIICCTKNELQTMPNTVS